MPTTRNFEYREVTFKRKRGDVRPFTFRLWQFNEFDAIVGPLDLTGRTMTFKVMTEASDTALFSLSVVIDDAPAGKAHASPSGTNMNLDPGDYRVQLTIDGEDWPAGRAYWKLELGED